MKNLNLISVSTILSVVFSVILGVSSLAMPAYAAETPSKAEQEVQIQATVNINTASVEELQSLKGIGKKKAQAIVEYRTSVGNFGSIDQLSDVKGIGSKTVENNKSRITI